MRPRQIENLRRARELDDPLPDEVCPGCGSWIVGWERYMAHHVSREPGGLAEFVHDTGGPRLRCAWSHDFLAARLHRRRLLRQADALGLVVPLRRRRAV